MKMKDFIKEYKIKMQCKPAGFNPNMQDSDNMDHWRCTLSIGRHRMTVPFSMGYGHNGQEPQLDDVLDCLASDASGFENSDCFESWAGDYGYDTDSRKAERTYKVVERQAKRLKSFLGEDLYNTMLWKTERL